VKPRSVDALLLSPWPESVLAYEPMWARLADHAHLAAIDLPGFGRSESRDDVMTPRAMGEFIVRAADAFALEKPHVIAPDVGTAAALFAAAAHPGRFRSLVVGSGGTAVPIQLGDPLREWVFAPDLEPYRRLGGRPIVERALQTLERYPVSHAAREDYFASYDGDRFAESMRYAQAYRTELEILRDTLPRIDTPVQIITGRRDRVVPPSTPSSSTSGCRTANCICSTPATSHGRTRPTSTHRSSRPGGIGMPERPKVEAARESHFFNRRAKKPPQRNRRK